MRRIAAGLIIGLIGALIGGFLGVITANFFTDNPFLAEHMEGRVLVTGTITGFLACFFLSLVFLKFMGQRSRQSGLVFGPLFGASAGAISGGISGVIGVVGNWSYLSSDRTISEFLSGMFAGIFGGALVGSLTGFVLALLCGPLILVKLVK